MTTAESFEWGRDTVCTLAGAPGFEPGITGPKPVALPLGYAPVNREAECTPPPGCTRRGVARQTVSRRVASSSAIQKEHGEGDDGEQNDADDREQADEDNCHRNEHDDEL